LSAALPAMMAELMAPIEMPATHFRLEPGTAQRLKGAA